MERKRTRIGLDFGRTIGEIGEDPAPTAFEMIFHFVHKFGAANIFVISKAGPNMEAKIRTWFRDYNFHGATGVLRANVIFVRNYEDKAVLVGRLGISIFYDDHIKVVNFLAPLRVVERMYWMHAKPSDILRIPKEFRHKVVPTKGFAKTMKFFQKIPSQRRSSS